MSQTTVRKSGNVPGGKWWLPILLLLIIAAIIGGTYAATHRGSSHKATPTPTATARPTSTAAPTPTPAKAVTHPTATPRPTTAASPTSTPTAAPSPTSTVLTGTITPQPSQLATIQQGANSGNPSYTYYLNPFQVVQRDLGKYGFTTVNIVLPTPQPSPTPYTGNSGLPEVQITVQYQGKRYLIVLDQPKQQGPKGIWVIVRIKPL